MNISEKLAQMHGNFTDIMRSASVLRLNVTGLHMSDGSIGENDGGMVWPAGTGMGATWDVALAKEVGTGWGKDARSVGVNTALGPMCNLARDGRWGRSSEGFGEDPYLSGKITAAEVQGIQSVGVAATTKHYTAYSTNAANVILSRRSLYEIYNLPFQLAVQEGGTLAIMSSYNAVNGSVMANQIDLIQGVLKDEMGFNGLVMSDWGAVYDNVNRAEGAMSGLDMSMPNNLQFGPQLYPWVVNGTVPIDIINDHARRTLRVMVELGMQEPGYNPTKYHQPVDHRSSPEARQLAYKAGKKSIILGKNENNILPLSKTRSRTLAIVGGNMTECDQKCGMITYYDNGTTLADAVRTSSPGSTQMFITAGLDSPPLTARQAIMRQLNGSQVKVTDDWSKADEVIVVVGIDDHGEGGHRDNIGPLPFHQDDLVGEILKQKKNVVVVYTGGSFCTAGNWSSAPGLIFALYPGLDQNKALADVLFGDYNPAGRLPITFPQTESQLPGDGEDAQFEDVWEARGYPYFDYHKTTIGEPAFYFGHGLSYTTFKYSDLSVKSSGDNWIVTVQITNNGARDGEEVVQLYVHQEKPSLTRRVKDLRGFQRVPINASQSSTLTFTLTPADLAFYDDRGSAEEHHWLVEADTFTIYVGASSNDLRLSAQLKVPNPIKVASIDMFGSWEANTPSHTDSVTSFFI
jgi:beta-glucosidase